MIHISGEPQDSITQLFNFNGTKNITIVGEFNVASVKCFDETGISYSLPYSESEDSHLRCSTIRLTG